VEDTELRELAGGEPFTSAITPAVLIDTDRVRENIATTIRYLSSARRWRPNVKTARLGWTVDCLLRSGVTRFKASTLSEVELLLQAGARDVLLAYPAVGPTQWRLVELASGHPAARVSTLADHVDAVRGWRCGPVAVFLDVDTGGGRTGIPAHGVGDALAVLGELRSGGFEIGGLHSYDGHLADLPESEQRDAVTAELHELVGLAERLEAAGTRCRRSSPGVLIPSSPAPAPRYPSPGVRGSPSAPARWCTTICAASTGSGTRVSGVPPSCCRG
jgi:D-serine deaminase-like pyridoxal phosphate-dependent protein